MTHPPYFLRYMLHKVDIHSNESMGISVYVGVQFNVFLQYIYHVKTLNYSEYNTTLGIV